MHVEIDGPKCVASGQCVLIAPDAVGQTDDDTTAPGCRAAALGRPTARYCAYGVLTSAGPPPAPSARLVLTTAVAQRDDTVSSPELRVPLTWTIGQCVMNQQFSGRYTGKIEEMIRGRAASGVAAPRIAPACPAGGEVTRVARFQFFRTDQQQVRWRLLGGNNRVLGVSARPLADRDTALVEVGVVRDRVADADFELEHVHSGLWWWRMRIDELGLARSAHGFARRVDATLSSGRFRDRAPDADVDLALVVFQPGRRGREVPIGEEPTRAAMWPQRPVG